MKRRNVFLLVTLMLGVFCSLSACSLHDLPFSFTYSIPKVAIEAHVDEEGNVSVTEDRTYHFSSSVHGVYWLLPMGQYQGKEIRPQDVSVGKFDTEGRLQTFSGSSLGQDYTFSEAQKGTNVEVKVFDSTAEGDETYRISYVLDGLALRYQDTAELYWKFVSDGWDRRSENVTCTITLPVPKGEQIEGEKNVWAYGHGPLDGEVTLGRDCVTYTIPYVGTDEFAEARILFPASWLPLARMLNGAHFSAAQEEEDTWAKEADQKRIVAQSLVWGSLALLLIAGIIGGLLAYRTLKKYREYNKPLFKDEYYRDVPSKDHPAVLGSLYHRGKAGAPEMSATLMRLVDEGVFSFDPAHEKKEGALLYNEKAAQKLTDEIDKAFVSQVLLPVFESSAEKPNQIVLNLHELEHYAKSSPAKYQAAIDSWRGKVEAAGISRLFYVSKHKVSKGPLIFGLVFSAVAFLLGLWAFLSFEVPVPFYLALLVPVAAIGFCIYVVQKTPSLSEEAIELDAKLHALKHWLTDFTKLKEAIPQDVVLWNHLLVMACVLGVSKEVLEELKIRMPELVQNPSFIYYYPFMLGYGPNRLFYSQMGSGMYKSYHASVASVAASSASSHGGGGGFSGGGGGGFGGGGGGGAF